MKFEDKIKEMRENLKNLLTQENLDQITTLDKGLDELESEHKSTQQALQDTKDSYIDYVKKTGFKGEVNNGEPKPEQNKSMSLDEAIEEGIKEIIKNRKEN